MFNFVRSLNRIIGTVGVISLFISPLILGIFENQKISGYWILYIPVFLIIAFLMKLSILKNLKNIQNSDDLIRNDGIEADAEILSIEDLKYKGPYGAPLMEFRVKVRPYGREDFISFTSGFIKPRNAKYFEIVHPRIFFLKIKVFLSVHQGQFLLLMVI
jgi:hypothetical protein